MHIEDYNTDSRYQATLITSQRITSEDSKDEVRELTLELLCDDFQFEVGQSVGLLVPGPHEFGHEFHFRLYTIADTPTQSNNNNPSIKLCVKRCHYIDDYSGEHFDGIASNYLCDLKPGQNCTLTGPYGLPFEIPTDKNSDILMIGMGTGIAPFRAFVKHIYQTLGSWQGKVRLYYGAHSGLEMLYMNDERNDFSHYYDEETFKAFQAISARPYWSNIVDFSSVFDEQQEIWKMLNRNNTHVYVAGHEEIRTSLDHALEKIAGSAEKWKHKKNELEAGRRWTELIYGD